MTVLEEQIQEKAYALGYEKCGIIPIAMMEGFREKLEERMQKVPSSKIFYRSQRRLINVQEEYPWAKSVVVLAAEYGKYRVPEEVKGRIAKAYLFDSRVNPLAAEYQQSVEMEQYLQSIGLQVASYRKFGLVGMRWAAMQAGIGIVRRNNFFYTEAGSWIHLEAFLIDRQMKRIETPNIPACPEGCQRCISACPTKSLSEPYTMQPDTCISYLTTFGGRDMTNEPLRETFGTCIYGCDLCQEACTMNKGNRQETDEFPGLSELVPLLTPESILHLSEEVYREKVQPKFFYLSPEELWKWKVNVLCYIRNNNPENSRSLLLEACNDENQKVREMAQSIYDELEFR